MLEIALIIIHMAFVEHDSKDLNLLKDTLYFYDAKRELTEVKTVVDVFFGRLWKEPGSKLLYR